MKLSRVVKFIIAVIVFYAVLASNVFHIGEKLVPDTKDYLESDTIETGHSAADNTSNLEALCNSTNICNKIAFKGDFLSTEKYTYIKSISKILQFIDDNSNENKKIEEGISTIEINKDNGNRRGYATRDTIIFNLGIVKSVKEFSNLEQTHK